ncbi:MAG: MerR family transcriptional regulator [Ethanoligenens sp.]
MDYSIGAFSEITGLSIDTLRYYEKERLIQVERDTAGKRKYTDADTRWIEFIKRLKETGMPIRKIRTYAELRYQGDATMQERLRMLQKHRAYVLSEREKWDENLAHLDAKIQTYKERMDQIQALSPDRTGKKELRRNINKA